MNGSLTIKEPHDRVAGPIARAFRIAVLGGPLALAWFASADTIELRNNDNLVGTIRFGEGVITVLGTPSGDREFSLDEIKKLEIKPSEEALAEAGWLAPGWRRGVVGESAKSGSAGQGRNALVIQSGTCKAPVARAAKLNDFSGHLVYRKISFGGHIEARVDAVDAAPPVANGPVGGGGLLLRSSSASGAPSVQLVVAQDGGISARASLGGDEVRTFGSAQARLPCSLRLDLRDEEIEASFALEGEEWKRIGSWQIKREQWLAAEPAGADATEGTSQATIEGGFVALGSSPDQPTTVRFTTARFSGRGLLGHYFFDDNFADLAFNRIDPFLKFEWGSGSPHRDLAPTKFSVRWEGFFTPEKTAEYIFYLHADDSAVVSVDGELVNGKFWNEYRNHQPTPKLVEAGMKHRIEISMFERRERGPEARLWLHTFAVEDWEKHNRRQGGGATWWDDHLTGGEALSCEFDALAVLPEPATGSRREPGVELIDGSFLAGRIASADRAAIHLDRNDGSRLTISLPHVARIQLQARGTEPELQENVQRGGLLFTSGDLMEAQFEGVRDGILIVSSVLLGPRRFALNDPSLSEFNLRKLRPNDAETGFMVTTIDGSQYRATEVAISAKVVRLKLPLLRRAAVQVPSSQIKSLVAVGAEPQPR